MDLVILFHYICPDACEQVRSFAFVQSFFFDTSINFFVKNFLDSGLHQVTIFFHITILQTSIHLKEYFPQLAFPIPHHTKSEFLRLTYTQNLLAREGQEKLESDARAALHFSQVGCETVPCLALARVVPRVGAPYFVDEIGETRNSVCEGIEDVFAVDHYFELACIGD